MKKLILLLIIIGGKFTAQAQTHITAYSAHVFDQATRKPLPLVSVSSPQQSTYTDFAGAFSLKATSSDSIRFSSVGYNKVVFAAATLPDTIFLVPSNLLLKEVTVTQTPVRKREKMGAADKFGKIGKREWTGFWYKGKLHGLMHDDFSIAVRVNNTYRRSVKVSKVKFLISDDRNYTILKDETGFSDPITVTVPVQNTKILVRLHAHKPDFDEKPASKDVLLENLVMEVGKNQEVLEFDISEQCIMLPTQGLFFALDFLGIIENDQFISVEKLTDHQLHQFVPCFMPQDNLKEKTALQSFSKTTRNPNQWVLSLVGNYQMAAFVEIPSYP
ncbi:hypothetical protein SAMN05421780_1152 [Flexibacter flexilis DSM 6793]|uniref:CarboxypepD_reg-like domain-containing protein n=1 Tax=Flexibacter flexilis DSM 6793 TaxID=927664 RepID=A0A1I1NFT4_9BACT|nr:carboxypeptidase-like regulatory domain-containing protein [Flexibacter flexilis]SFC96489.1 hypothetical protein SAMN05421780_1152 [Flexibacter flexilis DSM 6793]